jgi:hypothetical protein
VPAKALNAHRDRESVTAFYFFDLLVGGKFPSRLT